MQQRILKASSPASIPVGVFNDNSWVARAPQIAAENRIQALQKDITRYTKACRSNAARPVDFINLMNAKMELADLA